MCRRLGIPSETLKDLRRNPRKLVNLKLELGEDPTPAELRDARVTKGLVLGKPGSPSDSESHAASLIFWEHSTPHDLAKHFSGLRLKDAVAICCGRQHLNVRAVVHRFSRSLSGKVWRRRDGCKGCAVAIPVRDSER